MKPSSQISKIAKLLICVSEIFILISLFGYFFLPQLSPNTHRIGDVSALFGWMVTLLVISYLIALWFRPITFYLRSTRSGVVWRNVTLTVLYMTVCFTVFLSITHRLFLFKPMSVIIFFLSSWLLLLVWRLVERSIIRFVRVRGHNIHRVVFVGSKDNLLELYEEMRNPFYGYKVIGYFEDAPVPQYPADLPYLGTIKQVVPYLEQNRVQQLYCCLPSAQAADIRPIIDCCERKCVRFFSVPNVRTYLKRTMQMEILGSVPVLYIREDPLSQIENRFVKRLFDIVVSGLFMIPFWLIIYPIVAIITKITQPGPVFFKQQRNGINGEVFYCYKFRSMKVNADADKVQATENDPRKTKFGNFLRKSSIDELPQFINVLKGEMSIVGPRPHMLKHTEEYSALIDKYMVRHWVRPGITGWAQVTGARGETKELSQMEDRIKKDIWYIENWTFFLDIRIIFMTVLNALGGDKQAY